jgi:hypothetical protein
MVPTLRCALVAVTLVGVAFAADPTPEDFALRILPDRVVVPDSPDGPTSVELAVTLSSAVGGVQGWSFGVLAENNGLTEFCIENAWEHADLAAVAGDGFTGGSLVAGRPSFDIINFYVEGHLNETDPTNGHAANPNAAMDPDPTHNSADGISGTWAAVAQACVLDFDARLTLPTAADFGVMALRVRAQGEGPNSGTLAFSNEVGKPPVDVVVVWNSRSFEPYDATANICIQPGVRARALISFGQPEARFLRGDANSDGRLTIADAIFALQYIFSHESAPSCVDATDVNDNGMIGIDDPITLLFRLFGTSLTPSAPFGLCEVDRSDDALDCQSPAPCAAEL